MDVSVNLEWIMKKPATVESVLAECTKAVKSGLGKKTAGAEARKFWINRSRPNIKRQLDAGVDWNLAKKRVLPTAKKMGKVAAVLAGERKVVPLWAAEAAAVAVKNDPKCPGGPGSGGFCP